LPGEIGRVVISSLHNFATPLLRYDIGDLAEVGEPCSCGRGLLVLNKILGRVRNMLTYPSGEKAWPIMGTELFNHIAGIKQFQFIQETLTKIIMNYVSDKPINVDEENNLRKHIQLNLAYNFDIEFYYKSSIAKSINGKYEDFISRL